MKSKTKSKDMCAIEKDNEDEKNIKTCLWIRMKKKTKSKVMKEWKRN
jgi:hypothetical protein